MKYKLKTFSDMKRSKLEEVVNSWLDEVDIEVKSQWTAWNSYRKKWYVFIFYTLPPIRGVSNDNENRK